MWTHKHFYLLRIHKDSILDESYMWQILKTFIFTANIPFEFKPVLARKITGKKLLIFWHSEFNIWCQIGFKKSNSLLCKFYLKSLIFGQKMEVWNSVDEMCTWPDRRSLLHSLDFVANCQVKFWAGLRYDLGFVALLSELHTNVFKVWKCVAIYFEEKSSRCSKELKI